MGQVKVVGEAQGVREVFWGLLLTASLVLASAVAAQQPARAGGMLRRQPMPDSIQRDSTIRIEVRVGPNELAKMLNELMVNRITEERIASSMHEVRGNEARSRELEAQLMQIVRRNAGLVSAIRLQCANNEMQPAGYMGLNFVGIEVRKYDDGPALYYFGDNPQIVSVDPGSPAQKAGIEVADEVIAINGMDARKPVPLGALLKPGSRVALRYSRDGKTRETTVTIDKRPDDVSTPCAEVNEIVGPRGYAPQAMFFKRSDEVPARVEGGNQRTVMVSPQGSVEPTMALPRSPGGGFAAITPFATSGVSMVSGAAFLALDSDWKETLGVDRGLLVTLVSAGSPAQAAGLKKGDIILSSGDEPVSTPAALRRLVGMNGANGVTLKVLRGQGKATVTITLKPRE